MSWTRIVEAILLPPAGLIYLALVGLALLRTRRRRLGIGLLAASVLLLYLLATPLVQELLVATLDRHPPVDVDSGDPPAAGAVVVLGAGSREGALEYGGETVTAMALERLRYGAWLHRRLGRPLLVAGISGAAMASALEQSFGVPVRWLEGESRNTHQNAVYTERVLRRDGVVRVYLVTHFWHMPRAVAAFRHAGLEVVPAPMGFTGRGEMEWGPLAILPAAGAMGASVNVFHEWLGRLWYRLRYGY